MQKETDPDAVESHWQRPRTSFAVDLFATNEIFDQRPVVPILSPPCLFPSLYLASSISLPLSRPLLEIQSKFAG